MERLAFVTELFDGPSDEGLLKTAFQLARSLSNKVSDLQVYSRPPAKASGFQWHPLPRNKLLLDYRLLWQFKRFKPEVVIYLPASSGTLGGLLRGYTLKCLSGAPKNALIFLQPRSPSKTLQLLARILVVDYVFAQSHRSVQSLKEMGFNANWIPGGVDPDTFVPVNRAYKSELRKKYGLPESAKIVLHIGHLDNGRNLQDIAHLSSHGYLTLVITSQRFKVDIMLRDSLIKAGVMIIANYIERIEEIYQLADVYLFPTFQTNKAIEAPLSVLEAMSCNLPVVTTRFGALPDMFQESNGLFFFEHKTEMVDRIEKAINDQNCNTRALVSAYSWDAITDRILSVIGKGQ